ncbi:response regulator transcription factor [Lactococcus garvieae]|jgi:DNA-binding response OmpR family regulator|uniref:Two component transcriptional regulator, winged helix family n=1 Tax=Lactococcus garvieae DCC43 TaxID=1231377 RepID=K2PGW5_9LACT|nr:response regulator transcription factor [Lactococcus garvieae]EKF50610.1 two component transcriptional regulator, winged helix family [Lactococcus garvieae DCC43]QPS70342.1 response regulator transcription factor [Lactococcus garvieae]
MVYTVLVCDDDKDIQNALKIYMEQDDYKVLLASNGKEALEVISQNEVHLLLLDVMMPVLDGISTAVKIRETSNLPIIFLSAKSEDTDRILGLKMGADDYVSKPFNPIELLARVDAALRRYARFGGLENQKLTKSVTENNYQNGGLVLDTQQKKATIDGRAITLTAIEYKILHLLITHLDQVFSSDKIYEKVWEEPAFQASKTVSVHIRHLREKIEINPKNPQYIKVIYGLGYKMVKIK